MAALPARQPGLPVASDEPGARSPRRLSLNHWAVQAGLGIGAAAILRYIAHRQGIYPRVHVPLEIYGPPLRVIGAAIGLFALSGFGVVRLCLPDSLRATRAAWILPVGACTSALLLTAQGFAGVPMGTSLWVTLALGAGVALAVLARSRRLGAPEPVGGEPRRRIAGMPVVWALYIAALIGFLALIPLIRSGFPTVIGDGSDAHLAAGTAQFLAHHAPTTVHPQEPVNQVPALWSSKVPIYYVFAAVASLSGLPTYQVLTPLSAVMFALVVIGFFLIATEILRASPALAGLAAGAVGLDREVLFTVIHPFYNQTWGLFTTPFAMVLGWVVVADGGSRRKLGTVVLLALFLALCGFAYPLALPIPLLAISVFWLSDRRERRRRGEAVKSLLVRPSWTGRRSLLWLAPLGLILAIPVLGSLKKLWEGVAVLADPSQSLSAWAGGMTAYIFEPLFFDISTWWGFLILIPGLLFGLRAGLRSLDRSAARGLATVLGVGLLLVVMFRLRDGFYFHFKLLTFLGPIVVLIAIVGFARMRRVGVGLALGLMLMVNAVQGALAEEKQTSNQLPRQIIVLGQLSRELPRSASIRLDMNPPLQLWVAYFLHPHPLCSQRPLLNQSYPHVLISRRADYILINNGMLRPFDAIGPAREIGQFLLYRARPPGPGLPGPSNCSPRMVPVVP